MPTHQIRFILARVTPAGGGGVTPAGAARPAAGVDLVGEWAASGAGQFVRVQAGLGAGDLVGAGSCVGAAGVDSVGEWAASGAGANSSASRAEAAGVARALVEAEARRAGVMGAGEGGAWVRTAAGQPQLEGIDGWFFSISYAGDLVGVASARCPVGLDLEPATRRPAAMLARRFASDERAYIAAAPGGAHGRDQRFLEIWTKKESYLKWRGCGLAAGLASFSVLQPARLGVQFWPVGASAGLMGHVCAATVGTTAGTLAAPTAAPTAAPSSQPD